MTQYAEVALPAGAVLLTVFNNAVTAIPDKTAVLYETVSGKEHAVVIPTASAGCARTAGIAVGAIPASSFGTICIKGPALAIAGDTSATGVLVMVSDVTAHMGEVIAATATASTEGLGKILTAGTAQGDTCVVDVNPQMIPKAAA